MSTLSGFIPVPAADAQRYREAGYWRGRSLPSLRAEIAKRYADRPAIVAGETRLTYREFATRVDRLALHLVARGIRPLDRVVLQMPNSLELVELFHAVLEVGAIAVLALPAFRALEMSRLLSTVEPAAYAIPASEPFLSLAREIAGDRPGLDHVLVAGPAPDPMISIPDLVTRESGLPRARLADISIDPGAPAVILGSGGTTGVFKLVAHTHEGFDAWVRYPAEVNEIRPEHVVLNVLPMVHGFALQCGIAGFLGCGAKVVLGTTAITPAEAFATIERERVTHLQLVPAILARWMDHPAAKEHDLSSLQVITTAAQKLPDELKRRVESLISHVRLQEIYGATEGPFSTTGPSAPAEVRLTTLGDPPCAGTEVRLVDDEDREVPAGEPGELLVKGPYTVRGYFRGTDELNARAFTPDGFYRTGDMLRRHPSNNLVYVGRKNALLINRGGEKISAVEVEALIHEHPAVAHAACIPVPDPVLGERVCACVVLRPGASLTLDDLASTLLARGLAKFKLPERLEIVPEIPVIQVGKVARKALAEMVAERLA
jgi:2,3-dihydroxybenzoate-AMP ligase